MGGELFQYLCMRLIHFEESSIYGIKTVDFWDNKNTKQKVSEKQKQNKNKTPSAIFFLELVPNSKTYTMHSGKGTQLCKFIQELWHC